MRFGKRQQARRIMPPPVQEAVPPPPRLPMASFPTGPFEGPPMAYGPDGSPTDGYFPDGTPMGYPPGQPWMGPEGQPPMGPPPGGPPGYPPDGQPWAGQDGQPWMGDAPGGFPPMAYAFDQDGGPVLYSPGVPPPPWQPGEQAPPRPAPPRHEPEADRPRTDQRPPDEASRPPAPEQRRVPDPARPPEQRQAQEPAGAYGTPASSNGSAASRADQPSPAPAREPAPAVQGPAPVVQGQAPAAPGPASADADAAPRGAAAPQRSLTPEPPQMVAEPEPAEALVDIPLWPDFAPERPADTPDGNGVQRLPTATQAPRLRLDRPVEHDPLRRSAEARLSRLYLRGGMLGLARASLEQTASAGTLDRAALADLAEARWRAGDLAGAAEAAEAHLRARGDEPIARIIAAEQAAQEGRILDARQLATQVHGQVGEGLERLFAGEPRSAVWPPASAGWMDQGAVQPGRYGLLVGGAEVAHPDPGTWPTAPLEAPEQPPAVAAPSVLVHTSPHAAPFKVSPHDATEASREVDLELQAAERDLARGDLVALADRLGLLLRRDPALAPVILSITEHALAVSVDRDTGDPSAADGASSDAASGASVRGRPSRTEPGVASLQMLRGDIHRGLGHELDATQAYQEALRALPGRAITREST